MGVSTGMSINGTIRAATREDVPSLLALIRGLADYERLSHQFEATAEQLEEALFCASPAAEAIVAQTAGTIIGFALFFTNFSTFLTRRGLYLEDLFVHPDYRGRGYGKALFQHLAHLAVQRGCGRFEWSVLEWNQPAIRFYRAQGAEVMPDWRICRLTGEALKRAGEGVAFPS